jgi:hypothetical protein
MGQNSFRSILYVNGVRRPFAILLFLIAVSGLLILRLFSFISRYAVNILFYDQWSFYSPLFDHKNLWQLFSWQHGPHREGIGLVVTALLANATHWNSRADALASGVILSLALLCAFVLKWRLFGSLTFADVTIPFIFLTLFQYEALVVVPNLSYGVFPVLLVMMYCMVLLVKNHMVRYLTIFVLNFLLIYTGFGVFMGLLTMCLLLIDIFQSRHHKKDLPVPFIAFVVVLVSNLSFLISYHFDPAIPNFSFSVPYLFQYPLFVSMMLSAYWGWHAIIIGQPISIVAGTFILLILVAVLVFHGRRFFKEGLYFDRISLIVVILIGYSLIFCIFTAVGRTPLGLQQAQVSRYLTLLIPAFLALYFHLYTIRNVKLRQLFLLVYLLMSIVGSLPIRMIDTLPLKNYNDKKNWKACYLQYEDVDRCDQLTRFQIFPVNNDELHNKLSYLKEWHLNLFLDVENNSIGN